MTVALSQNRISYAGNGSTTAFSVPFPFQLQADLVVVQVVVTTGVEDTQVLNSDYTISGSVDVIGYYSSGGTVTMTVAPPATDRLVIYRSPTQTQGLDLQDASVFPAESVEAQLDKLTMISQRLNDMIGRAVRAPDGDAFSLVSLDPMPAQAERANMFLAFNANGHPIAAEGTSADLGPVTTYINTLLDDANAGEARTTLDASKTEPLDSVFRVVGSSDATKKLAFEVDGLTTGTTRTVTVPDQSITLGTVIMTPIATTSGSTHDWTSIPVGVREITLTLSQVSTTGTGNLSMQIGDSGGIENTGYISSVTEVGVGTSSTTSAFLLTNSIVAGTLVTGSITLTLQNTSTNTWVARGVFVEEGGNVIVCAGNKSLTGILDRVRLSMTTADTYDAGQANVSYRF